ncbi:hypothetical protein A9Q99_17330 [Gammaproteobacteria bacterium 45_16_T64]|nr:hypothetical protein A9Q99_17330 [Gammaproteobacteria bacterium 45_16_T64]
MTYIDVTEKFCENPEKFMEQNVVLQWIQDPEASLVNVGVKAHVGAKVENKPGAMVCHIYNKSSAPSLPSYWCPYQQNGFKSTMLGNEALFAFTSPVNGCSVGLGSGKGGVQMMAHVNTAQVALDWRDTDTFSIPHDGPDRQTTGQDAKLKKALGKDSTLVSRRSYGMDKILTVFAVHGLGLAWQLKAQAYKEVGKNRYHHYGVTDYV